MRKILIPLLTLCMLFMSFSTAYATEKPNIESCELQIKSVIEDYFDNLYKSLSQLKETDLLSVSKEVAHARGLQWNDFRNKENAILGMKIDSLKLQREDLTFDEYSYKLNYKDIAITGDVIKVQLLEDSAIRYNQDPNILSEIVSKPHTFSLQRIDGEWVLIDHRVYDDYFQDTYEQLAYKGIDSDEIREEYIKSVKIAMQEEVSIENSNDPNIDSTKSTTRTTARSYNRTGAVNYALQYATSTSYPSPYHYYTADCTNFISICLHEGGGISQDTVGGTDRKWYWYSSGNRYQTWTGAKYFRHYIYLNNNSTSSNTGIYGKHTTEINMQLGDIMSFSSSSQTWIDGRLEATHSAIVTKIVPLTSYGVIVGKFLYVCQHSYHSAGYKNVPIATLGYNSSGQKMYLHIVRYYD